jgi:hypothetical protein
MPLSFLRDAYQFWTVLLRSAWEQHSRYAAKILYRKLEDIPRKETA